MYELKKYHGDRVQSLTYEDSNTSFSVGIISPGEYEFGAIREESYVVTSGEIECWVEGKAEWSINGIDQKFSVPVNKNFKLKVNKVSSYICFYE